MARALLADRDRARLDLVATVLTRDGLDVVTASHLEQAAAALDAPELDLVLCAEDLPGGGGLELARRAAATGRLRVVLLGTGSVEPLEAPGCDALLPAPFRYDALRPHLVTWGLVQESAPVARAGSGLSYRVPLPAVFSLELPPAPALPDQLAAMPATAAVRDAAAAVPALPVPLPVPVAPVAASLEELPELDLDVIATPAAPTKPPPAAGFESAPVSPPAAASSRPLRLPEEGDLAVLPFPRLVYELYVSTFTGAVHVTRSAVSRTIYFRGGLPVRVDAHQLKETLGRLLLEHGRITIDQYNRSLEIMQQRRCRQGEALLEIGALGEWELLDALRDQTERKLSNTFAWRDGAYRIDVRDDFEGDSVLSEVHPLQMIWRGVHEHYDEESLLAYLMQLAGQYAVATELFRVHYDALGPLLRELSLPQRLDGNTRFEALLSQPGSRLRLAQALYVLLVTEMIVASPRPGPAAVLPSHAAPATAAELGHTAVAPLVRAGGMDAASVGRLADEIAAEYLRLKDADFLDALRVDATSSTEEVDAAHANIAASLYLDDLPPELPEEIVKRAREVGDILNRARLVVRDPRLRERYLAAQTARFTRDELPHPAAAVEQVATPMPGGGLELDDDRSSSIAAEYAHSAGRAFLAAGRFEEAAQKFRQAIQAFDREPTYRVELGRAILGAGGNAETARTQAVTCLQQALQLDPSHAEANLEMAKLLHASGNTERARAYVQRVLQKAPENQEARRLLASLG